MKGKWLIHCNTSILGDICIWSITTITNTPISLWMWAMSCFSYFIILTIYYNNHARKRQTVTILVLQLVKLRHRVTCLNAHCFYVVELGFKPLWSRLIQCLHPGIPVGFISHVTSSWLVVTAWSIVVRRFGAVFGINGKNSVSDQQCVPWVQEGRIDGVVTSVGKRPGLGGALESQA